MRGLVNPDKVKTYQCLVTVSRSVKVHVGDGEGNLLPDQGLNNFEMKFLKMNVHN